mgnify:CR=1 FL=1
MTDSVDDLLPDYERELAILRGSLAEFAQRNPEAAARLSISGEHSDDPHIERLIQSAALLNARASLRINDNYPELPTGLLEILRPEYLRPFPSCSIARFEGSEAIAKLTSPFIVERGTELKTRTGEYRFHTVYDVTFSPLQITDAGYAPPTSAPAKVRLHEETSGIVSIEFGALSAGLMSSAVIPKRVRIFVDGNRREVATIIDTLLLRTSNAFVEVDGSGTWIALDPVPVSAVGFDASEALIERRDANQSYFRLLLEYFSFPEKFDFIDVEMSALMQIAGSCHSVTLHLPIKGVHPDSHLSQHLRALRAANLKLLCTPVVNLFVTPAEPIAREQTKPAVYPIMPGELSGPEAVVYRVDEVSVTMDTPTATIVRNVEPFLSFSKNTYHAPQDDFPMYWLIERDTRFAETEAEQNMLLSLVDASGAVLTVGGTQIGMELTCTNGNAPAKLQIDDSSGDFVYSNEALTGRVSMSIRPTPSVARSNVRNQLWDVVSMLSAGPLSLCEAGLPAFKALLTAHAPSQSACAKRQIESLTHLSHENALDWVIREPQPSLMRGMRVRLAVDEALLADCAMSVFARVLETVFAHYAPVNSFVQLAFVSAQNGAELVRGKPLPGAIELV